MALRERIKEELDNMERMGVIKKVEIPTDWANSLVIMEKHKTKQLRICLDPRPLNKAIKHEHFQLPTLEDITTRLSGAKRFSKLDAKNGYWQIPSGEESQLLTTFSTPFGRYCFARMPFGVKSAQEVFQKRMCQCFGDLPGVEIDIDDMLVWGASEEEHNSCLQAVLQRCKDIGLTLNKDKCKFNVSEVTYLGHTISANGVAPDKEKVRAIAEMPPPDDKKGVERLLGVLNYVGKFILNMAAVTKPIRELLKFVNAPEIYMEPSEYMLVPNRNYKRVATWSYITDLKHNEKNMQTVINGLNLDVKYRTQPNSEMSSSLLLFTSQLDDSVEDDGPKPGSTAMDCAGTSGGLSLSFRDESMRMERLLGSICQPMHHSSPTGSSRGTPNLTPRGTPSLMDTARNKLQTRMADMKKYMIDIAHASHHLDHLAKTVETNRLPKGLTMEPRMMLIDADEETAAEWKEQTRRNTLGYIDVAKRHYTKQIARKTEAIADCQRKVLESISDSLLTDRGGRSEVPTRNS